MELEVHEVLVPLPLLLSTAFNVSSFWALDGLDSKPFPSPPLSAALAVGLRKPVLLPGWAVGVDVRVCVAVGPAGPGLTFRIAYRSSPPAIAWISENVPELPLTGLVVTVKVALVAPCGTVTLGGTCATVVSRLDSATTTPPAGAALVSVTVPCEDWPPVTVVGFKLRELNEPGGRTSSTICFVKLRLARRVTLVAAATG